MTEVNVVTVGAPKCGRTALRRRFVTYFYEDDIDDNDEDTSEMEGYPKQVTVDDETFILHIFHKATLDNYVDTVDKLERKLVQYLICFAVDSMESLEAVSPIAKQLQEGPGAASMIIVGCKGDLDDGHAAAREAGERLAHSLGVTYIVTSAKSGSGVEQVFAECAKMAAKRVPQVEKHSRRCQLQ